MSLPSKDADVWCAMAKIVADRPYGPNGEERRRASKHFHGGAKVYVIDAYWGPCESVTVVGHHRKSGRLITLDIRASFLENFSISLVYSPAVKRIIQNRFSHYESFLAKEHAQKILEYVPRWDIVMSQEGRP